MNHSVFQYVPLSKSRALSRLIPKIIKANGIPILDIEDSVRDTIHPDNTRALKAEARACIPALIAAISEQLGPNWPIYFRINAMDTPFFTEDMEALTALIKDGYQIGIFLTKACGAQDLKRFRDGLACAPDRIKVVPLIETVKGVQNLESLLADHAELTLDYIHYGHYDYSLDSEAWPFLEQDNRAFWDFVEDLIHRTEASGLRYMHTPFGRLHKGDQFEAIIRKIASVAKRDFAVTALNFDQTLCGVHPNSSSELVYVEATGNKLELAKAIVAEFEDHVRSKRSFSMNLESGEFVTPHHYERAKTYIRENEGCKNSA